MVLVGIFNTFFQCMLVDSYELLTDKNIDIGFVVHSLDLLILSMG